jgi:hypothetical protein
VSCGGRGFRASHILNAVCNDCGCRACSSQAIGVNRAVVPETVCRHELGCAAALGCMPGVYRMRNTIACCSSTPAAASAQMSLPSKQLTSCVGGNVWTACQPSAGHKCCQIVRRACCCTRPVATIAMGLPSVLHDRHACMLVTHCDTSSTHTRTGEQVEKCLP